MFVKAGFNLINLDNCTMVTCSNNVEWDRAKDRMVSLGYQISFDAIDREVVSIDYVGPHGEKRAERDYYNIISAVQEGASFIEIDNDDDDY